MVSEYNSPLARAIATFYKSGEEDESMIPLLLFSKENNSPVGRFQNGDYVIFYNIRGEREIELTESLTNPNFDKFPIKKMKLNFVTMIEYDSKLNVKVAFPRSAPIKNTLTEIVSKEKFSQIKIAESEKGVHVTYFFNGKNNKTFPGEDTIIVESPKVEAFDSIPEMKAAEVSKEIIKAINKQKYDLIVANLCNIDVIGHTENIPAIKKAIETVDRELGRILKAAKNKMRVLVTADHGTVEEYYYPDGTINTGHTKNEVPFIYIDDENRKDVNLLDNGSLTNIAPTILSLLKIKKPAEMTESSLLGNFSPENKRPVLLLILDGWGYRKEVNGNLIRKAYTPNMDSLIKKYPFTTLKAAGESVGMPEGTVGNSEVGHLHIGAGRIILSDRKKIDESIKNKSFFENEVLNWAMDEVRKDNKNLHLLGIVSFYSSHGSLTHLFALMDMAKKKGIKNLYIHSILGRRGEKPESGARYIEEISKKAKEIGLGQVVSVIGRKWAMDREKNWERVEKAYRLFVHGEGKPVLV